MNITVQAEVALPKNDESGTHFQIQGFTNIELGNIQFDVKQLTWQFALNKLMPTVVTGINFGIKFAEGILEGLVWDLNKKLASGEPIIVSLSENLPKWNITAPRAPEMN